MDVDCNKKIEGDNGKQAQRKQREWGIQSRSKLKNLI